jgi:hypothetical protein
MNGLTDEEREQALDEALFKLATGQAYAEEIGKDENGTSRLIRRKLPPNLDAIKYLREIARKKTGVRPKRLNLQQLTED